MKGMRSYGKYGAIGFELVFSIIVGYWVGDWLDRRFQTTWIKYAGFVVGCYAGFRALWKAAKTMNRDIENEEALARGEDPWEEKPKGDRDGEGDPKNGDSDGK